MRRSLLLLAMLAAASLALSGCGAFSAYALEVNGDRFTQDELRAELNAILENEDYLDQVDQNVAGSTGGQERAVGDGEGTFNSVFVAALLDRRIGFALIHQEVERRKLEVTEDLRRETRAKLEDDNDPGSFGVKVFRAFPKSYQEELVTIFAEQSLLQEALGSAEVSDDDVAQFYEENKQSFERTCVRHILVADKGAADAIKARLDAGEDFAAIARAESTDNQVPGGSAEKGGDLGCVSGNELVPEFSQAMNTLPVGGTSGPVESQFGFHIIQVTERKTIPLEEAAAEIRPVLEQRAPDPIQVYIDKALEKAEIKVNPRYGRFEREPRFGVKAPKLLEPSTSTTGPGATDQPQ